MIAHRQVELDNLFILYSGKKSKGESVTVASDHSEWTQADKDLCAKITGSKQGEKFQRLFKGQFDDYESQSEADQALCNILAFWCRKDFTQMDRIFRQSKLYRPKWDDMHGQQTYGAMTLCTAVDSTDNVYGDQKESVASAPTHKQAFRLVHARDIKMKPIQWLVHGIFEQDSLALLFGDPACGKSFLVIDVVLCVATGTPFHGHRVEQGVVVYIAGEGHNGVKRRMNAWSLHKGVSHETAPVYLSQMPAALTDAEMVAQVKTAIDMVSAEAGPPVLIVIDTLARNFGPGDENSTQDMGRFIQAADAIRAISQATVLIVHHSGHGDKQRARGAMALKGALDAEYRLDKDDAGIVRMEATKMKDAPRPEPCAFQMKSVPLGVVNEDGEQEFSAVLELTGYAPPSQKGKAGKGANQTLAMSLLKGLYEEEWAKCRDAGKDPATVRISKDALRSAMKNKGIEPKRANEVLASLAINKMITERDGHVFLSPL